MIRFAFGNSMWGLIAQSDATSKLVLLILFGMSVICWTILAYKFFALRKTKRQLIKARQLLITAHSVENIRTIGHVIAETVPGVFLNEGINKASLLTHSHGLELYKDTLDQTIEEIIAQEESYLSVLFASASVSPLLGLFGTVWGLVHSFISISKTGTADIAAIAPGIAEALMTTLAGLMVAVPALLMYHYLRLQVQTIDQQLMFLRDRLLRVITIHTQPEIVPTMVTKSIKHDHGEQA